MLDTKQKVLIAIYAEYQKDRPDMAKAITAQNLGLDVDVFNIALMKLDNEDLVNDLKILKGGSEGYPTIYPGFAKMSVRGIDYVETKLDIAPSLSGEEKVKLVIARTAEWGWEQMKDVGAKILAQMIRPQTGV